MSGVLSIFPVKSLRSGFWTTMLGPCPDEPQTDLMACSVRGSITFSFPVKSASCMRFSTVKTSLSNVFLIFLTIILPSTWFRPALSTNLSDTVMTTYLLSLGLFFHYTHVGIINNYEIVQGFIYMTKLFSLLILLFSYENQFLNS